VQYGAYAYVPIWLTEPAPALDASVGFGVLGRVGWEFTGGLSTELFIGYQANSVEAPAFFMDGRSFTLTHYAIGGGLRYAFLNPSALVPFIGASLQVAVWSGCGDLGCAGSETLLGFGSILGLIYEVSANVGIEGGAMLTGSLEGDLFDGVQLWLSPFVGVTLYY
jgi:hypothetical protein